MQIENESFVFKLYKKNHTAILVKSKKINGPAIIPKFIEHKNEQYAITKIGRDSFTGVNYFLTSIFFDEDSEVTEFDDHSISSEYLKKIQIPAKLEKIGTLYCPHLNEIEVSPKNKFFKLIENQFLVGKSQGENGPFDTLHLTVEKGDEVLVPPQIKFLNSYSIISSFQSIVFPKNSQLQTIEAYAISKTIKRLILPGCVENINFYNLDHEFEEFKIIGENKYYTVLDDKFLLKKSKVSNSEYDELVKVLIDVEEIVIPKQIKCVKEMAFNFQEKVKSIIFPSNSKLKIIEEYAFSSSNNRESSLEKLILPGCVECIKPYNLDKFKKLTDFQITGKNKFFTIIDNKMLLKKSEDLSSDFDELVFVLRNSESITIPPYVKKITDYALSDCKLLTEITFPENSTIETIGYDILKDSPIEKIVFPKSVKIINNFIGDTNESLTSIQINSQKVSIDMVFVYSCPCLEIISFPNASEIDFGYRKAVMPEECEIHVRQDVKMNGSYDINNEHIKYVFEPRETVKSTEKISIDESSSSSLIEEAIPAPKKTIKNDQQMHKEVKFLIDYIKKIEKRLEKYEKVTPFDPKKLQQEDEIDYEVDEEDESQNTDKKSNSFFFDETDEKNQEFVCEIGEGNSCIAYKIIDHRRKQVLCKKIIKNMEYEQAFKELKKKVKEMEVHQKDNHPCICEMIGVNLQERLSETKTTAAFFFEYLPYSLKELIENKTLNNTMKTKIAVEIAFGMSFIHNHKQIHRDLNIDCIRLNDIFESKITNFSQVHIADLNESNHTLTKFVGTFAFMSPEMAREEDYNEKTDVYSYGVILYVLFNGKLPKQSMNDKIKNKKIPFPKQSPDISKKCINLIKKCMEIDSKNRPSFDDIIDEMYSNSFELASDVDMNCVLRRYRSLNRLKIQNEMKI